MDMFPKLENLQFLGIFGILQESLKLIYQWRKIFTQITLSFILPCCLLNLAHIAISISSLTKTQPSTNPISSQIIYHLIFNILSPIIITIFSLLSTATVIYTVACIYTGRDVSFQHVIAVLPNVWRRLLVTYLCVSVALFSISFVAILVITLIVVIILSINGPNNGLRLDSFYSSIVVFVISILFVMGTWYFTLIWRLSSDVSVLEESCGFKAMAKSKALVKGKMRMITKVYMLLSLPSAVMQLVFYHLANQSPSVWVKCLLAIISVVLFSLFFLVSLVVNTVVYFVCKSYHHESVDEFALSTHLQTYLQTDYVPLKLDDQIEKLQIV